MNNSNLVFCYGSLKQGYWNFDRYLLNKSRFVGSAITATPEYTLVNMGSYPGVVSGGKTTIIGEVFEVDDNVLSRLDKLEGHPNWYKRHPISVKLESGEIVHAEMYMQDGEKFKYDLHQVITSGEWVGIKLPSYHELGALCTS
jgi:gamma-glutamylcyclotransferase (GGCT)/AIG2-like uncharacterized protein YtfP